jgi:two-component system LytT family response regulator
MKIVIIEDENAGVENLKYALAEVCPECVIQAVLPTVNEAVSYFKKAPEVDLLFSDIQLDDRLAFEAFEQINREIPVIFVTAYHQYAIEAFKHYGLDYVLKPFTDDDIKKALAKARTYVKGKQHIKTDQLTRALSEWNNTKRYKNTFLVNFQDRLIPVAIEDIAFFYKDDKTQIKSFSDDNYMLNSTLDDIEEQLDPQKFYRLNRQMIIQRKAIKDIRYYFNGRLKIKTKPAIDFDVIVSKAKATHFKNWIKD